MNWKKVISIVLIGVLGLMCMTACQATAGTSEENHVPDTSTAAQENADNQVTEDETSGRTIVVYFGADYSRDAYGWTLDLEKVKRSVDVQLRTLQTDYIDYGFIHCQDELSDWDIYKNNGVLDYLLELKKSGVVRHIGLSSHTPEVIQKILDDGMLKLKRLGRHGGADGAPGSLTDFNRFVPIIAAF